MNHSRGIETVKVLITKQAMIQLTQAIHDDNIKQMLSGQATTPYRFGPEDILGIILQTEVDESMEPEVEAIAHVRVKRGEFIAGAFLAKHAMCMGDDSEVWTKIDRESEALILVCPEHATEVELAFESFRLGINKEAP